MTTSFSGSSSPRPIANICNSGACPTIFEDGPETLLVQGFVVAPEQVGVDVPAGETVIRIPRELLIEAVRNLS